MKKVLIGIIISLLILLTVLSYQNNQIRYNSKIFLNKTFSINSEIKYNKLFKVNDLSISTSDYYYSYLDKLEKQIYTNIIYSIKDLENEVIVSNISKDLSHDEINKKIEKVMNYIFLDHPEIYYVSSKYSIFIVKNNLLNGVVINLNYEFSKSEILENNKKINNEIDRITLNVKNKNQYEIELELHDYVAKNIDYLIYEKSNLIEEKYHSIYGPLIEKKGVCDGLSKTLQILFNKMGIASILVTGKSDEVGHGWLMVNIDNSWYNLDITGNKYIDDEYNNVEFVSHAYFNVTTESLKNTHEFNNEDLLPISNSNINNYYVKEDLTINTNENFSKKIKEIFDKQKDNLYIEFSSNYKGDIISKIIEELYNTNYLNNQIKKNNNKIKYYKQGNVYTIKNN